MKVWFLPSALGARLADVLATTRRLAVVINMLCIHVIQRQPWPVSSSEGLTYPSESLDKAL
jgi:hypothetical protein